jgi:hypothetical protein
LEESLVVKVKLQGLKIARARGKYYVYRRATGEKLISGFVGKRADLERQMATPEFIAAYNRPRTRAKPASTFSLETLGGFISWFTNGDIDRTKDERRDVDRFTQSAGYPKWPMLSDATRQDYLEGFEYLRDEFDVLLADITQPDLYEVRDKCVAKKWPRFADQMISALSSMFRQAVKRGKMPFNPCLGMDKAHTADPNSNREWYGDEWEFVRTNAPMEILIPCMIARFAGLAGQTIVGLNDKQFHDHPLTGKSVRYTRRKNKKATNLPVDVELQRFLAARTVHRADGLIAVRDDGTAWLSEKEMQSRVSHWLRDRERDGLIGAGTTLHGLRVSYAAWWKRSGATNSEVADLIGDASEAMGAHYTRHVDSEVNVVRAFERARDRK